MAEIKSLSEADREDRERKMYGTTLKPFLESVEESFTFRHLGPGMVIVSMLSDAQELIAMGHAEDARQTINRVKYLVNKHLPSQRKDT